MENEYKSDGGLTSHTTRIPRDGEGRWELEGRGRELRVGLVLWERYEILAVLGMSALGEMWRCFDRETGQEVALRWLSPDMRRSKPVLNAIYSGIRRIADQTHPGLAAIRQMVYVGEQIYLVGDYAPGMEIGMWGRAGEGGKRTLEEVLPVLRQVAAALDFAHSKRILHRNLKPSNIFLAPDGVVRVTDFGLAPHRHMTIVHGGGAVRVGTTGPYLAPELREEGSEPDSASDQYALGMLACELLTGHPEGPDATPMGDLAPHVQAALRRALARKPRNRFVTCMDFLRALSGEHVGGRRGRSPAEWRRVWRRAAVVLGVLGLGGALVGGGFWLALWLEQPEVPPAVNLLPPAEMLEKPKTAGPVQATVTPLVVTTSLPEPSHDWVTQTARMEFIWVAPMRMWVGRFEVTNEEYQQKDPAHTSGEFRGLCLNGARQPAVRLNFDDATAYAAWLTEQERAAGKLPPGWRYRLPSSIEAITYTRAGSVRTYPWGDLWPPSRGNYADASLTTAFPDLPCISNYQDGFAATAPVEASGENEWRLFGAGGNVWETTSRAAGIDLFGGWQGGGWDDHVSSRIRCDTLYGFIGNARGAVNGFRLVLAPISEESPPPSDSKEPGANARATPP